MAGRLLAVSDMHGCFDHFIKLLQKVKLTKEDTLVVLGDFIDRGPQSRKMIEVLIKLKETHPNTVVLMGNHEQMFLDYLDNSDRRIGHMFIFNGGRDTLNTYPTDPYDGTYVIPGKHIKFIRDLPLTYETDEYFFCHAGVNPANPLNEQTEEALLWIRDEFLYDNTPYPKKIVHGHTPSPVGPTLLSNRINLDGGGVFGNTFWLVDLTNAEFYGVDGYIKPRMMYNLD